ncbi:MAG: hypothetical protein P9L90_05440 [Candidatus Aadella gelida]|nr:hypothetical protein [Candidatus Aadella gelida]
MMIPNQILKYFKKAQTVKRKKTPDFLKMTLDEFESADVILEVKSKILEEHVYFVSNEAQLAEIPKKDYVVYFARELKNIVEEGIDEELLKSIHLTKKVLGKGVRCVKSRDYEEVVNKKNKSKEEEEDMGKLSDFVNRNSEFVKLEDGGSIELIFKEFEVVPNPYDDGKEIVNYTFEMDGKTKTLRSAACTLARAFDKIQPGTKVRITRKGLENKTSYKIEEEKDDWLEEDQEKEE